MHLCKMFQELLTYHLVAFTVMTI